MMSFVIFASLLAEERKAKSHRSLSDTKARLGKAASNKKARLGECYFGAADGNRTRDLRVLMSFVIFASLLVEEHKAKSHHSLSDTKACLGKAASNKKKARLG